jgi:predicted ATPase
LTSFTSLVCPVIVGRTHELDALERQLGGGGPLVVVVSGEVGIGKSRLIAEAKRRARGCGMQGLHGACYEYALSSRCIS